MVGFTLVLYFHRFNFRFYRFSLVLCRFYMYIDFILFMVLQVFIGFILLQILGFTGFFY